MNTLEAFRLFEVTSVKNINKEEVKKKYRQLLKDKHPDVSKSNILNAGKNITDIKLARQLIEEYIDLREFNSKRNKRETFIISLNSLKDIYARKKIEVGESYIDISKIRTSELYIECVYNITINGVTEQRRSIIHYNIKDEYDIWVDIEVYEENSNNVEVSIELDGKNVNFMLSNMRVIRTINYEYNIDVRFNIQRIIIDKKGN